MSRIIRPHPCDWPALFWRRATSSYADNDLVCRACLGSGCGVARGSAWEGMTVEDAACPSCRSSGLLVPARELPDDVEAVWAADEAGGCSLAWLGHEGDGLIWPAPWSWAIFRRRFPIRHDVYVSDGNALAFMLNGSVLAGLFCPDENGPAHLAAVFRLACGEDAELPVFVLP